MRECAARRLHCYLLLSDNKTGFSADFTGQGQFESPQNLKLGSGGFTVNSNGTITGTSDNFDNGTGTAIDTSHVILAAKFQDLSLVTGFKAPNIPGSLPTLLAGELFIEVGKGSGTFGVDLAETANGAALRNVV